MSQLEEFHALAQSGQEMSRENLWPVEIRFDHAAGALAASGGALTDLGETLGVGGFTAEFTAGFRLRAALLPDGLPEVGTGFVWRRAADADWRPRAIILRAHDPADGTFVILAGPEPQ